jgi:protein-tyrosine phosphatase
LQALSVATNAENKSKNGSDSIIPYDRNRVILTPDGARPHSTYINASFIEGYHNDESFIITQDPLEVRRYEQVEEQCCGSGMNTSGDPGSGSATH